MAGQPVAGDSARSPDEPAAGLFFGLDVPFLHLLGVRAELAEAGHARISLELRRELLNSFGVSHGGVVMTMLDVAMAMAARSTEAHARGAMTVDLSASFLRGAHGRVVAEGRVLHHGGSLFFCEAEARDGSGERVAKAIGTFKLRRAAAAHGAVDAAASPGAGHGPATEA